LNMLIWLASYPRSGNTFVRVVLNDVFGIKTQSMTGDGDDRVFSSRPGVVDAVGHLNTVARGDELIEEARHSEELYFLKTHEPPLTDDPAIYIVRDGRSAVVSYFHYVNEIENQSTPLEAIIDGNVYAGSWSEHFSAWQPLSRPRTLLLRYEEIVRNSHRLVEQLAWFCSAKPISVAHRSFTDLHRLFPEFFRKGDDASNIQELEPHLLRFMRRHGDLLQRLGYIRSE
jgi:sulfotransferase family protein